MKEYLSNTLQIANLIIYYYVSYYAFYISLNFGISKIKKMEIFNRFKSLKLRKKLLTKKKRTVHSCATKCNWNKKKVYWIA